MGVSEEVTRQNTVQSLAFEKQTNDFPAKKYEHLASMLTLSSESIRTASLVMGLLERLSGEQSVPMALKNEAQLSKKQVQNQLDAQMQTLQKYLADSLDNKVKFGDESVDSTNKERIANQDTHQKSGDLL